MFIHQLRHRRSKRGKINPSCTDENSVLCTRVVDAICDLEKQTKDFLNKSPKKNKENTIQGKGKTPLLDSPDPKSAQIPNSSSSEIESQSFLALYTEFCSLLDLSEKLSNELSNGFHCSIDCLWTILQNLQAIWFLCFEKFIIELKGVTKLSDDDIKEMAIRIDKSADMLREKYQEKFNELSKEHLSYLRSSYKDCINEYVHFLVDMGQLYLSSEIEYKLDPIFPDYPSLDHAESRKPLSRDKAADFLNRAIEIIEGENPREVRMYPLQAIYARALSRQDGIHDEINYRNRYKSLKHAKKAQIISPMGRDECQVTGEIYSDLMEYEKAKEAFNVVTAFSEDDREDPDVLMRLGWTQLLSVRNYLPTNEKAERGLLLKNARDYFERAWRVYDRSEVDRRGEARYYIGLTHMEGLEYNRAIPHFLVVYNVRDPGSKWLFAALQLGRVYLKLGEFYKSEKVFRDAVEECLRATSLEGSRWTIDRLLRYISPFETYNWVSDLANCTHLNTKVKIECGEGMALGSILTKSLIGLALSKVERDVDPESVMGIAVIARILAESELITGEKVQEELISEAKDCQGRVCYKIGLTKENKEARQEAIQNAVFLLEKSVFIRPNADNYLHLAQAYRLQLDKRYLGKDGAETLTDKIKACICHSRRLDFSSEYETVLKELEEKLKDKELSQINSCPKMKND